MAKRGLVLLPPAGRLSLIHVDDLARLLLALAASDADGLGRARRWPRRAAGATRNSATRWARAVGRKVRTLSAPRRCSASLRAPTGWVRGDKAKLTADRAAYFCHPDWTVSPDRAAPAGLWQPRIDTEQGLADTARWYRSAALALAHHRSMITATAVTTIPTRNRVKLQ